MFRCRCLCWCGCVLVPGVGGWFGGCSVGRLHHVCCVCVCLSVRLWSSESVSVLPWLGNGRSVGRSDGRCFSSTSFFPSLFLFIVPLSPPVSYSFIINTPISFPRGCPAVFPPHLTVLVQADNPCVSTSTYSISFLVPFFLTPLSFSLSRNPSILVVSCRLVILGHGHACFSPVVMRSCGDGPLS